MHVVTAPRIASDERWFEDLFTEYSGPIRTYFRRRDPDYAEDGLAEVFTVAWRRRSDVPDPPLPWLYGVAGNILATRRRSLSRRTRLAYRLHSEPHEHDTSIDTATDQLAAAQRVRAVLEKLPAKDAEVLRLWAWEELDSAQIAVALGISPSGARTRLARARTKAAAALGTADNVFEQTSGEVRS